MNIAEVQAWFKSCPANKTPMIKYVWSGGSVEWTQVLGFERFTTTNGNNIMGVKAAALHTPFGPNLITDRGMELAYMKPDFPDKFQRTREDKNPPRYSKKNFVGVEIEFISSVSRSEISSLMAMEDLEEYVVVKEDASIDSGDEGHDVEVCILAKETEINNVLKKVCRVIAPYADTNYSCGLHVHLDMRNRNRSKAYENLFYSQPLLYKMNSYGRYEGEYCRPEMFFSKFISGDGDEYSRYQGINRAAYSRHKTLEVRIADGTTSHTGISKWIDLLLKIVNYKGSLSSKDDFASISALVKKLCTSKSRKVYVQYMLKRYCGEHKHTQFRREAA